MHIKLNDQKKTYESPLSVQAIVEDLMPEYTDTALGCLRGGTVVELDHLIKKDTELTLLTYADEEGRRIYERTLRFVFLLAVERCFPQAHVRFEHSVGHGVYVELEGKRLYPHDVMMIEEHMRDVVAEDLPFTKGIWTKEKAIAYFNQRGEHETARLLAYRPYDDFNVYECGGLAEYFYGAMLPSTGKVGVFALHSYPPGLILLMPSIKDSSKASTYVNQPKQMATFAQSNHWCRILECTDAADLNDLIAKGRMRDFIRTNEALHDKSLSDIAEDVARQGVRAVFIAGPSSSGKTTFANRLAIHLRVNGLRPVLISLDDFYRNRVDLPLEEDGQPDLEALDALDVPLFTQCISSLLAGHPTAMPKFDFTLQRRKEKMEIMQIDHHQLLIIEGIHALNPMMHQGFEPRLRCRIYISELTCLNLDNHNRIRTTDARLLRRIVRDHQFRNTPPQGTLAMWDKVRRGEDRWIFPFQENADIVFNSALHYELPVLKQMVYPLLKGVSKDDVNYVKCNRLLKILHYLMPVPETVLDEIPPLSILREFIGGNTLYLHEQGH